MKFRSKTVHSPVIESAQTRLELLYHISREFAAALDLHTVLQRVLFLSVQNVGAISGSVIVLDDQGVPVESALIFREAYHQHITQQLKETLDRGLAGWVAKHRQAVLVSNTSKDERWLQRPDDAPDQSGPKSAVSVPILARDHLAGVVTLVNSKPDYFTDEHVVLIQAIADMAGIAIQHAQLFERLQAVHQRYRELFEDNIDPIVITDWEGRIVEVNRQARLVIDHTDEDLHHMLIEDIHQIDRGKIGVGYEELASGKIISYESALHVRNRQDIPVQVYARKVQIEGVSHLQWILRDLTERKDLDNLREELLSMIYHDLRSPLGNIVSSLDVLDSLLPDDGDETLRSLLNIAMRSTERIQRLTNSLLDINRLEAGQPVVDPQPLFVPELMHEAIEVVLPMSQMKEQQISVVASSDLPEILVDGDMIRRVLINLLENAVKYSPANGSIRMGAESDDEQVTIWVQDDGPGIPSHEQERIFEKFARLRAKDGSKGLGLGLAYCRLAVLTHGGRIWAESLPGNGSTFKFTLPVAKK